MRFKRKRKVVLLVDPNPDRLCVRAFVMETQGLRVLAAETEQIALGHLAGGTMLCDVLVADVEVHGEKMVHKARLLHPGLRTLGYGDPAHYHGEPCWDEFAGFGSMGVLLDLIKTLCSQWYGPRANRTRRRPPAGDRALPAQPGAAVAG